MFIIYYYNVTLINNNYSLKINIRYYFNTSYNLNSKDLYTITIKPCNLSIYRYNMFIYIDKIFSFNFSYYNVPLNLKYVSSI